MLRRSKGRVVNVTSGLARITVPSRSPYIVTKFGLDGFSDVLRHEMKNFGVKVISTIAS